MAAAEQRDGWLVECEGAGRFLVPCRELIGALADLLRSLDAGPVLEVCAGSGELAARLRSSGVPVVASDADPPAGSGVPAMPAGEALSTHGPKVALGVFVPTDAGVDEAVLDHPAVEHYVVLSPRIGGLLGSPILWEHPHWTARPLDQITPWMLTRHDVWLGRGEPPVLQHGEAWHLCRKP
jgi:hypothetical protein